MDVECGNLVLLSTTIQSGSLQISCLVEISSGLRDLNNMRKVESGS